MAELGAGPLDKMRVELADPVRYALPLGEAAVTLNELLGSRISLEYLGRITCCHSGRRSNRSFGQGYCYPCFQRLAACDGCIVSATRVPLRGRHLPRTRLGDALTA